MIMVVVLEGGERTYCLEGVESFMLKEKSIVGNARNERADDGVEYFDYGEVDYAEVYSDSGQFIRAWSGERGSLKPIAKSNEAVRYAKA